MRRKQPLARCDLKRRNHSEGSKSSKTSINLEEDERQPALLDHGNGINILKSLYKNQVTKRPQLPSWFMALGYVRLTTQYRSISLSLSLSLNMMWRDTKLLALGLITVLLHACFFSICVANSNKTCRPSSCGDIQNISDPFRLKGDPDGCGDRKYELVCENNHTMVKLYHRKYYVAEINYPNHTIRVVDPSLKKGNCFSTPPYSLTRANFSYEGLYGYTYGDPYQLPYEWRLRPTLLMNCDGPVSGHNYIPIVPCNSPSSQTYAYAVVGDSMQVSDIPYSCTMGVTIVTRLLKAHSDHSNRSMANLQEELLRGVEISFLPFRCKECDVNETQCCNPDFAKNTIQCETCDYGYEIPTRNGKNYSKILLNEYNIDLLRVLM